MPPMSTSLNNLAGHPPVLQVGRQQFVLNVISRCEKETQTQKQFEGQSDDTRTCYIEKGVQANIPLMPEFEGTVPANLPNGKKVKYADAKEKTKYAVKRAGKKLFDQFLQQLDDISGGCAHQLLSDIYRPKDSIMATNYEKILASIGTLYKNVERGNRQERLRLLSTVALHATNEALKRYFQRMSKKGDIVSVNEAEIVQAREYAKQFGPGTHVMPVGQVSWKNLVTSGMMESAEDEDANEADTEKGDEKDNAVRASKGDQVDTKIISEGEKLNVEDDKGQLDGSSENSGSPSGGLSPDTQAMGKDKEKKLITFEKMNPSEQGSAEKKQKQLVTFKVTVRHSKDKTGDGTEQKGVVNDDTAENEMKANSGNADKGEEKNVNTEKLAGRRNGKPCHDSGKEDSKSQVKKRRRNTFSAGTTEKSKRKSDVTKSDDKDGDMREKRRRTAFSNERKMVLEKYFEKSIYASKLMVEEISRELSIDRKKIDNWFRNRRSKLKKDEEERSRRDVEMKERKGWNKENSKSSSVDAKEPDIRNISQSSNGNPEEGQGNGSPEVDRVNCNPEVDRGNGNPEVDEKKENAQTKGSDAEPVVAGKEDNVSATKIEEGEQRTSANNVEAEGIEPSTENPVTKQIEHVSTDVKRPRDSQTLHQTAACQNSQEAYEVKEKPDQGQRAVNKKSGSISNEFFLSPDQNATCTVSKITSDSSHDLEKNLLNKDRSQLKNDLRTKSKTASASDKISDLSSESNCAIINKENEQTSANATSNDRMSLLAPPVLSGLASPVVSDLTSPVVSDLTSPVVSDLTSPVISGLTSPVVSVLASPVVSDLASPDPNAIVLAPSVISQSRSGETFLSKPECYLESRVVPETSWSSVIDEYDVEVNGDESDAPEDLALALNNDPDFMKDLNELMDIAKA
ncbi:uncharacterized protein LOC135689746 [Rhopilema esculentum]|uniref:uncharacterized protein LOC135689746 n=1 Tax=Rhopilema esculentum TaxID=499914 RepID=UPI0031E0CD79